MYYGGSHVQKDVVTSNLFTISSDMKYSHKFPSRIRSRAVNVKTRYRSVPNLEGLVGAIEGTLVLAAINKINVASDKR